MRRILTCAAALLLACATCISTFAATGNVSYDDKAKQIIFAPGSDYSPTDFFPDFKGVMPGDTLTQKITVKNNAANKVKVKIYLRALGAHEDSKEFLSQLGLLVHSSAEDEMAYMFNASADKTAQLTDWVCLGTLYSGGTVNLDVVLYVPIELENEFQSQIGYLDWEFKVEEFPVESGDPKPPQTGDYFKTGLWFALILCSGTMISLFFQNKRKKRYKS